MVQSLPFLESKQLHSFSMPNKFNFAFNYHYFIIVRPLTPSTKLCSLQ